MEFVVTVLGVKVGKVDSTAKGTALEVALGITEGITVGVL
jgi:hypothetical protein